MFGKILVPLDGSSLSERALPVAEGLARASGSEIVLLHVPEAHPPSTIHGEKHLTGRGEAVAYLDAMAKSLPPDIRASVHVHEETVSDVGGSLASHASEFDPCLVVMCAHGKHELRDIFVGSMAQEIVMHGTRPVLVVRSGACEPFKKMLIPLDEKPEHQKGLALARYVASILEARIIFASVVPTQMELKAPLAASAIVLPSATRAMLELAEDDAVERITRIVEETKASGTDARGIVVRGSPARELARAAEENEVDLVALATHGRHGSEAFWEGSFAPLLYEELTKQAFLFIPVQ